ncbi:ABC transporter substrate-binding protein [Burkholderia gladioli]|uniref:ABC transporter substrate-binding protein n=1 Tax=Burkholderia gladioli TaxID=28095 RepID=UPI003B98245F
MNLDPAIASALVSAFAPHGVLRASINLGNPILAGHDPASGAPAGVSVNLARALGAELGVPVELVVFATAGESVAAVGDERADVGFFAIDPLRAESIAFTSPYVLIEGCYLVREASPIRANEEVNRPGVRVTVGKGSAYDLFLTRELKAAAIERAPSSPTVVSTFLAEGHDVAAGVKQQLEADAARQPGLRLLDGRFMVIRQAMGLPRSRGQAAAEALDAFVEARKASGFVAEALARHHVAGASVAPAGRG